MRSFQTCKHLTHRELLLWWFFISRPPLITHSLSYG